MSQSLDRETMAQYTLTVAATDGVSVTYTSVTVHILDDNDNAPQCDKVSLSVSVSDTNVFVDISVLN